ncbi:hypothetical protein [Streptomyces sp. NBC_00388]|uniref:hypothetical protein n=1 Tax=Streptomyces sp. NBC_00388 TaxID=2975735 RepID=UPI002E1BEDF7
MNTREKRGAQGARAHALAVLGVRGRALAVALLPAAVAVVLLAGGAMGRLSGGNWDVARWVVTGFALVVLGAAAVVGAVIVRAGPAVSPTVALTEASAPDLHRMVRELADRLEVPVPSAIALTPDCDSWLEDRSHPAAQSITGGGPGAVRGMLSIRSRRVADAPVLVIGSPFLWWMRVAELRALLAPVIAGTGPSAHPDIAASRRFVRGLDAAVAVASRAGLGPVRRVAYGFIGWTARLLLRSCRGHAAEMERGVAAAASDRAQAVDYGLRIVAQEQVGLAYAGWDRLLTRVALPAWRMGRWPSRLDAGVVSALTELSRRDRLAEGFTSRLGERPACDLLEEPGAVDAATSLLAARLFHGGPADTGPDWSPVDWQQYPEEVVDRKWRTEAARLHRVLDQLVLGRSGRPDAHGTAGPGPGAAGASPGAAEARPGTAPRPGPRVDGPGDPTLARVLDHLAADDMEALAAAVTAEVAREESAAPAPVPGGALEGEELWDTGAIPLFPLQPPRTGRDLLADHVTAMVCCAAVDTAGAAPGLDWLDGPALLVGGERRADLGGHVMTLVEDGDGEPLREWLTAVGVRPEKPVRLV